ncbi:MAG: NUDIX domain-containing protein [Anaerolineae bacterium]
MDETPVVGKVLAYITRGRRLLVFRQPAFPEAGIQIPAGTMEAGETPPEALLREVEEETGLRDLRIVAFLGTQDIDLRRWGRNGIHRRYFFHLALDSDAPETWRHWETSPSDGDVPEIEYEHFWVDMPDGIPHLAAEQDTFLHLVAVDGESDGAA